MRTTILPGAATAVAWLERDVKGKDPEHIKLESLPFTLGRILTSQRSPRSKTRFDLNLQLS